MRGALLCNARIAVGWGPRRSSRPCTYRARPGRETCGFHDPATHRKRQATRLANRCGRARFSDGSPCGRPIHPSRVACREHINQPRGTTAADSMARARAWLETNASELATVPGAIESLADQFTALRETCARRAIEATCNTKPASENADHYNAVALGGQLAAKAIRGDA